MPKLTSRHPLDTELSNVEVLLSAGSPTPGLYFRQAVLLHNMGHLEEAKTAYMEVLNIDSTHLGALKNFGNLLHEMDFRRAAITVFERILQLYPNEAANHVNLANILWDHNDHAGARLHYELALDIDPDCPQAHQGMAYVLMELREDDAAMVHAHKGFAQRSIQVLSYRGSREPVSVLVLISIGGGNTPLLKAIDNGIFKIILLTTEFYDPAGPLPAHQIVWNAMGDADRFGNSLGMAAELLKKTEAPVINRPETVAVTGRAENTRRLAGIKNLLIPKTVQFFREDLVLNDAKVKLEALGFGFPLLLRAQGFHGGKYFMKIDTMDDMDEALTTMPGREFAVIQFLDSKDTDGKYRKYRIMSIDGKLYPLHAAISSNWKIHYFSAEMAENAEHRTEDNLFLSDMNRVLGSTVMSTIKEIQAAMDLDYFGIDFSLNAEGKVLFFESNATMVIVPPEAGEKWKYRRAPVQNALDAVTTMLLSRVGNSLTAASPCISAESRHWPDLAGLLSMGGDSRIICDPVSGLNQYGSPPWPEPMALAYGSCTASTISLEAFTAAQVLLQRLKNGASGGVETEFDHVRGELASSCGIASVPETGIIFAASGTDIHLIAAQMAGSTIKDSFPLLIVMPEDAETGTGVPAALAARHYSENAAMAGPVCKGERLKDARTVEIINVPSRDLEGVPVPLDELDARIEALVDHAVTAGQNVMLVVLDLSKTGLLAPSPYCAVRLKRRHPEMVDVLIDACQFRLAPCSVRYYVDQGFLVALTGSKFVTGPAFSGALLVPPSLTRHWSGRLVPVSLSAYCAVTDWPQGWAARESTTPTANIGLLLRWTAAITELKTFQALGQSEVVKFFCDFNSSVQARLADDSVFEPLEVYKPDRSPSVPKNTWDSIPTIFPFLLRRHGYLTRRKRRQSIRIC